MPNIETLARWAAANMDTDRELLEMAMVAAQQYLENAGVPRYENDKLYDLAVYQLGVHYFDNRGVMAEGSAAEIPMGVNAIMHQLRLQSEPEDGDGA